MLVLGFDRVRSRCIDNVEVAEESVRAKDFDNVFGKIELVSLLAVFEEGNAFCCRHHVGFAEVLTKERVKQAGLAGINLADDHEEEWILQVRHEIVE